MHLGDDTCRNIEIPVQCMCAYYDIVCLTLCIWMYCNEKIINN